MKLRQELAETRMERFWGSLKNQLVRRQRYATRAAARAAIQEDIERFYKRQRRHSHPGNVPPVLFAEKFSEQQPFIRSKECRHRHDYAYCCRSDRTPQQPTPFR